MINFFKKIFSIFFIFIFLTNTAFSNEYMNALFECKDAQSDHKAYFKMGELNGEKIDIIDYSDDPAIYVANALAPAKVSSVEIVDLESKSAKVIVPDYQVSLAIGKDGQNARLAARLTQWRIDIHPDNPVVQIKAENSPAEPTISPTEGA